MIPNFQDQLAEAARNHGIDRARGDHQINTLVAMRPVEVIENYIARASTMTQEQRVEHIDEIEQRVRALCVVAEALRAHTLAAFAAMGQAPVLLAARTRPVAAEAE